MNFLIFVCGLTLFLSSSLTADLTPSLGELQKKQKALGEQVRRLEEQANRLQFDRKGMNEAREMFIQADLLKQHMASLAKKIESLQGD